MSSNYGDKHFGVPVFDYFPWYQYPNSILEQPKLSRYYPIYRQVVKFDLSSVWYGDAEYFQTGGGYSESPIFVIDKLNGNINSSQTVESWLDIEKLRLISNLGLKQKAEEYLNRLDKINDFIEVIEDAELDYHKDFDISEDFRFYTLNTLSSNGEFNLELTDDDVISFIRQYNGDNTFYLSLKNYLSKNDCLTFRQIEAIKKKPPISEFINGSEICMLINNSTIRKLILPRLSNMGYKVYKNKMVY